jgi:hypothetical protein
MVIFNSFFLKYGHIIQKYLKNNFFNFIIINGLKNKIIKKFMVLKIIHLNLTPNAPILVRLELKDI